MRRLSAICLALGLSAGAANAQNLVPPAPQWFGALVERHTNAIMAAGYARCLSKDDLFHGHLLLSDPGRPYTSLDDALEHTVLLLYHTDESTDRWEREEAQLPAAERTPRSILGLRDGTILPAIDVVPRASLTSRRQEIYDGYGTVFSSDVIRVFPTLFDGSGERGSTLIPVGDAAGGESRCRLLYEIDFEISEEGAYSAGGTRYNLGLGCFPDPESAPRSILDPLFQPPPSEP